MTDTDTVIVKSGRGVVRSMSQDEYEALCDRAVANKVPISRQLEAEEAERS